MGTNCKKCNNCAWFCHSDSRCYGTMKFTLGEPSSVNKSWYCNNWSFDGLEDWEREDCEQTTFVAMEI